jgi:hypothetical protein
VLANSPDENPRIPSQAQYLIFISKIWDMNKAAPFCKTWVFNHSVVLLLFYSASPCMDDAHASIMFILHPSESPDEKSRFLGPAYIHLCTENLICEQAASFCKTWVFKLSVVLLLFWNSLHASIVFVHSSNTALLVIWHIWSSAMDTLTLDIMITSLFCVDLLDN